jgi:hypothetical protein
VLRSRKFGRQSDQFGFTGPSAGFFGASVLYPLAFQSLSGQNVAVV